MVQLKIKENGKPAEHGELCVDGEVLLGSRASTSFEGRIEATIYAPIQAPLLAKYSVRALAPQLRQAALALELLWPELKIIAELQVGDFLRDAALRLLCVVDVELWAGPFSLAEFRDAVRDATKGGSVPNLIMLDSAEDDSLLQYLNGFGFSLLTYDPDIPLLDNFTRDLKALTTLLEDTRTILSEAIQRDTLVTFFNFPPAVSTACEQYLLYFTQFLRDIGIYAEGDIRHRASQVLFSIRPEEGADALDRIREALDVYLQIPSTPELDAAFADARDIAVLQLQANVHHLRGQLTLASAVLQANCAEIEALKISNYQYRQMIAAPAEVNHIASLPARGSEKNLDEEPLLGGIVSLTEYEGKGFKVNLPAILRKLKRRLGSNEDKG